MNSEDPRIILYRSLELIEDYIKTGVRQKHSFPILKEEQHAVREISQTQAPGNSESTVNTVSSKISSSMQKPIPVNSISLPALAQNHATVHGDSLEKISRDASLCQACRLFGYRKSAISHSGKPDAKIIILTDTPSDLDDNAGILFAGETGQLLEKMLDAIGLSKDNDALMLPVTKCMAPHREPAPDEEMHCSKFLLRQLELLSVPIILCFGRVPAQCCTGNTREGLAKLRNTIHHIKIFTNRSIVCTYHPREVIANTAFKRPVWEDLKLLKTLL